MARGGGAGPPAHHRCAYAGPGLRLARSRYSCAVRGPAQYVPGALTGMSDYLTSLVQRARGETGAVRPIVQPVFAPVRADLPAVLAIPGTGPGEPEIPASAPATRAAARLPEAGPLPAPALLPGEQSAPGDS